MKYINSIDTLIKNSEKVSLSDSDILKITENKCKVFAYQELENYKTIDQALGEHGAAVILYQHEENFGHWVAVFKVNENTIEFFDPYGISMDSEIEFSPYQIRRHEGTKVAHLSHLIEQSEYDLIENKVPLQKNKKDVNTCGRFSALRIRFRNIPLKEFYNMLRNTKCYDPDFMVSAMTLLFTS